MKTSLKRWVSLDIFRGITIVLMIIVNSPGNATPYAWLDHSPWNGCTLADLVFPFFVFIIGVSLVFSLSHSLAQGKLRQQIALKVVKRSVIIFILGILLNAIPYHMDFATLRVFGVLQRLAICYCCAGLLFLYTSLRLQVLLTISLLIGYWLLLTRVPVPGYGINNLSPEGNLPAYLDRMIFSSAHLYGKVFDPEGMLSNLPAIASTLIGTLTGIWLKKSSSHQQKLPSMMMVGTLAIMAGWLWGLSFPVNKALWSSSFVLLTSGIALMLLAVCIWLIEIRQIKFWAKPFEIFGMNAIAAYVLHIVFLRVQAKIQMPKLNGSPGNLRLYITDHGFGWVNPHMASLLYSLSYILFLLVIFAVLYRRKIFIKI